MSCCERVQGVRWSKIILEIGWRCGVAIACKIWGCLAFGVEIWISLFDDTHAFRYLQDSPACNKVLSLILESVMSVIGIISLETNFNKTCSKTDNLFSIEQPYRPRLHISIIDAGWMVWEQGRAHTHYSLDRTASSQLAVFSSQCRGMESRTFFLYCA